MKYVIIEQSDCEVPVLFPDLVDHSTFSNLNPISAGFVTLLTDQGFVYVHGESVSLKLKSRIEDADLIKRMLYH
jgi:hypothetical protein